jgi:hypothetical protein
MMRFRGVILLFVFVVLSYCCFNYACKKSSFKGKIAAYRINDWQYASMVENKEVFLFRVEEEPETLIKLVYIHRGYSDIKDDVRSGKRSIEIIASRYKQCDQTLEMFEKDAPRGNEPEVDPIIYSDTWDQHLSKSYPIKCYVLNSWEPIKTDKP